MKTQTALINKQKELGKNLTAISWNAKTGKRVLTYSGLSFASAITELINKPNGIAMKLYVNLPSDMDSFHLTNTDALELAESYLLKIGKGA
ncbi:MAG: hypothetical protein GQ474_05975 [Sulfurimonas sp.]|nr:hypothetical protein [Sulfurimonas sp.]